MITITRSVYLDERELEWSFIHASGPGGQHVNKTATAAQVRFAITRSASLSDFSRARILEKVRGLLTTEGVLVITAQRFRSQQRNREDALERLVMLLREALKRPRPRTATKPTISSRIRRVEAKKKRGHTKSLRRRAPLDND